MERTAAAWAAGCVFNWYVESLDIDRCRVKATLSLFALLARASLFNFLSARNSDRATSREETFRFVPLLETVRTESRNGDQREKEGAALFFVVLHRRLPRCSTSGAITTTRFRPLVGPHGRRYRKVCTFFSSLMSPLCFS